MRKAEKSKVIKNIVWPSEFSYSLCPVSAYEIIGDKYPLIKGFVISGSGNKDKFYVHSFIQPLYDYFDTYNLTYGERVQDPSGAVQWDKTNLDYNMLSECINEEYNRFIKGIKNIEDFRLWFKNRLGPDSNYAKYFTYIYTCIASNKLFDAFHDLELLIESLKEDWVKEKENKALTMKEKLNNNESDSILKEMESNVLKMKKHLEDCSL